MIPGPSHIIPVGECTRYCGTFTRRFSQPIAALQYFDLAALFPESAMSDQYQFTNDPVAWEDWLQPQQPFWALRLNADTELEFGYECHLVAAADGLAMYDGDGLQLESTSVPEQQFGLEGGQAKETEILECHDLAHDADAYASSQATEILSISPQLSYIHTTCASCDAPLDNSEQMLNIESPDVYCTRNRDPKHLAVSCGTCGKKFPSLKELRKHAHQYYWYTPGTAHFGYHHAFSCAICSVQVTPHQISIHFRQSHPQIKYHCAQCSDGFDSQASLDQHGEETMHAAYMCHYPECGSEATRIGDLHRHQLIHKKVVQRHPCPHCRKYRGNNGFKRKDHLHQHIRNYHHIDTNVQDPNVDDNMGHSCPFEGCDKTGSNAFETEKLMKVHLKKEHPSPYQCSYPGCDRTGTKGWMRERDMVRHMKKVHHV